MDGFDPTGISRKLTRLTKGISYVQHWVHEARIHLNPQLRSYRAIRDKYHFQSDAAVMHCLRKNLLRLEYKPNGGTEPYLGEEDEYFLAEQIKAAADLLNAFRTMEIIYAAYEVKSERIKQAIIEAEDVYGCPNIKSKLLDELDKLQPPSRGWVNRFCSRNGLQIKHAREIEEARKNAGNPTLIREFWDIITPIMGINPKFVFNFDETFVNLTKAGKVIVNAGRSQGVRLNFDNPTHITAIITVSAAGFYVRPFFIIPGIKNLTRDLRLFLDHYPDAVIASTTKGWITTEVYEMFALHFISEISRIRAQYFTEEEARHEVLVFSDGHGSRSNLKVLDLFLKQNVKLIIFPAHSSHIVQPFDVVVASALKARFKALVGTRRKTLAGELPNDSRTSIYRYIYLSCITEAINELLTPYMSRKAFEVAGIVPCDVNRPLASPFMGKERELEKKANDRSSISGKILTDPDVMYGLYDSLKSKLPQNHDIKTEFGDWSQNVKRWHANEVSIGRLLTNLPNFYRPVPENKKSRMIEIVVHK